MKRKRKQEIKTNKRIKKFTILNVPYYLSSSTSNSKIQAISHETTKKVNLNVDYHLQQEHNKDIQIYGMERNKNIQRLNEHIHNTTKFIVQNNIYLGSVVEVENQKIQKQENPKKIIFTYFKTITYVDIPSFVIFRKYQLIEDIKPISKIFIVKLGSNVTNLEIDNYKKMKLLKDVKNNFTRLDFDDVKDLKKSTFFSAQFYLCFDKSENIFFEDNLFFLKYLNIINGDYDKIFQLYHLNTVNNIFVSFLKMEEFICTHLPIYYYVTKITNYPLRNFFNGDLIFKAIDFLKLKECYKQNYRIDSDSCNKKKIKVSLKGIQDVFELNKKYDSNHYEHYLFQREDLLTSNGYCIRNKKIHVIDIFSAFGNSFLNIYERNKTEWQSFKVLYDIIKQLISLRLEKSSSDIIKTACKNLVNAGCYGTLNQSSLFPLKPDLMKKIVKDTYQVMIKSMGYLELKHGFRRIYSKNDSHFLIHKEVTNFEKDILGKLNNFLIKVGYPNSRFKFKGIYTHGIWFSQNSYVLYDGKEYKIIGSLKSEKWAPKTIRDFVLHIISIMFFEDKKKLDFNKEVEMHKKRTKVTASNFIFKERDMYYTYVKNATKPKRPIKLKLIDFLKQKFEIDATHTYSIYMDKAKKLFDEKFKLWL